MTDREDRVVELRGVWFRYPGSRVELCDITLDVRAGERLAIVGPNGSGKTTLLRLMSGLLKPDSGAVRLCGLDPARTRRRELAKRVAVVGQQAMLGFPYTALEVVLMGRAPHVEGFRLESRHDVELARRAMMATGVADLEARCFDTLSSGERQRVSVARALAQQPDVLLLDEPAAFLDIKQQTALYDLLSELNGKTGLTVVSVLHDLNLVSLYFDRVAMLAMESGASGSDARSAPAEESPGRPVPRWLHAIGPPEEVLTYTAIRAVFETDVYISINELTGKLNVLPLPKSSST